MELTVHRDRWGVIVGLYITIDVESQDARLAPPYHYKVGLVWNRPHQFPSISLAREKEGLVMMLTHQTFLA